MSFERLGEDGLAAVVVVEHHDALTATQRLDWELPSLVGVGFLEFGCWQESLRWSLLERTEIE